jgi:hypothetical protein
MLHDLERGRLHVAGCPKTSIGEPLIDSRRLGGTSPSPTKALSPGGTELTGGHFTLILRLIRARFLILSSRDRYSIRGRARDHERP